jgi:hypothetical protein
MVGLLLAVGTGSLWAQTVPAGLIGNLHVAGIEKWDITNATVAYVKHYPPGAGVAVMADALSKCGSVDETPCYIIKMTVIVNNSGKENVLFEDPQLDVKLLQLNEKGEVLGTDIQGAELYKGTNTPLRPNAVDLGMARLVMGEQADWEDIANILAPENGQKDRDTQLEFEVIVGPKDLERAQHMITAFNIMNDGNRRWLLWLKGTAKVGTGDEKGTTAAMVVSSTPVEVSLKSRPAMPKQLNFPQ